MAFDLVVKNGMIVDGSGLPRYRGDVGVKDGKIAEIGRINGAADSETLDAEGHVVTPGFVDVPHPHGRADLLGSDRHQLLLPGRDQRGHGQLRLHPGALPRERGRPRHAAISSAPRTSAAPP